MANLLDILLSSLQAQSDPSFQGNQSQPQAPSLAPPAAAAAPIQPAPASTPPYAPAPSQTPAVDDTQDIEVQGHRPVTSTRLLGGERDAPTEDQMKQADSLLPVHGLFNTKGTLRDVLGTIGDAFLVQGGADRVYAPTRDKEKLASEAYGFTQNPLQAMERISLSDPKMAQDMLEHLQQNQARLAQVQSLQADRQDKAKDRDYIMQQNFVSRAARYLQAAGTDPAKQAAAMKLINAQAATYHLDPAQYGIHAGMTPEELAVASHGDMTTYQQNQLPISQQNADANTQRSEAAQVTADRTRPAPQPTAAGLVAPLIQKLASGKSLTPAENEIASRLGFSRNRGQKGILAQLLGAPPSNAPAPTTSAPKFQEGQILHQNGHTYKVVNGKPTPQ